MKMSGDRGDPVFFLDAATLFRIEPLEPRTFLSAVYAFHDIGTLGGRSTLASDVNDAGIVVGAFEGADGAYRAFLWTQETGMRELMPSAAPGAIYSPSVINDRGEVAGQVLTGGTWRPFIHSLSKGVTRMLERLPDIDELFVASSNNRGHILLWERHPTSGDSRWFVYDGFSYIEVAVGGMARSISDRGVVAGERISYAHGTNVVEGQAVNGRNLVVAGSAAGEVSVYELSVYDAETDTWRGKDGYEAEFAIPDGAMRGATRIGIEIGEINDAGLVVGTLRHWRFSDAGIPYAHETPFVMDARTKTSAPVLFDLAVLTEPPPGWVLQRAIAVNDAGQIVGIGTYNGQDRSFLLDPMPGASLPIVPGDTHIPLENILTDPEDDGDHLDDGSPIPTSNDTNGGQLFLARGPDSSAEHKPLFSSESSVGRVDLLSADDDPLDLERDEAPIWSHDD